MKYLHPKRIVRKTKETVHDWFFFYLIPDKWEIKYRYKKRLGKFPNLKDPCTFNEKIQWLKLNNRDPRYSQFIDKYQVKNIVGNIIGDEHIIPTICGGYKNACDIPWENLPEKFVVKCNHDAASSIICDGKSIFDKAKAEKSINDALNKNYYHYYGKQWGYKDISPCVFIEKYMEDNQTQELFDYKFMCFNGVPKCVFVCSDRYTNGLKIDVYDTNWHNMQISRDVPSSGAIIDPPKNLKEMLSISETLANYVGAPFLRVDLYEINGIVYFGELTFYPNGGFGRFIPEKWDRIMGDWIDLSTLNYK